MNKAQELLQLVGTNPDPYVLSAVADLTDDLPINKRGIEDQIELLNHILHKINNHRDSKVQGMANVGILIQGLT